MATALVTSGRGITGASENKNKSRLKFHQRCGRRITLSNGNRTAARSIRDFSHALVFSAEPLNDDELFEVIIEKKSLSWGGSIEIGVTAEPPEKLDLPSCATAMRNGSWVMSGIDVRKDGVCLIEFYGIDLESLNERDRVGVMRTSNNELVFYVNGDSQGVAARNMPKKLWALVDLYGRCVQVSICPVDVGATGDSADVRNHQSQVIAQNIEIPIIVDLTVGASSSSTMSIAGTNPQSASSTTLVNTSGAASTTNLQINSVVNSINTGAQGTSDTYDMNDRLRFHTRCGSLVRLSPNCRSAERRRPLDEFNNGVVMTHRPLRDNELFEIRIDKLVDKWSGSIEVGVTTHNPTVLHFPATMTNMRSGTIMMSGCGILTNGKGTRRQYGEFNLDELRQGDRVGMMRMSNSSLHYYINGKDQGVAATRVGATLWGVIDLYGMTIKVTIVDRDEREQQNLVTRRNNLMSMAATNSLQNVGAVAPTPILGLVSPESDLNSIAAAAIQEASSHRSDDRLTFHALCGSHATVTHSGRTALRPNASDDFNNGVVLTRRPLRTNELFQVRLERVVTKWAGSIEVGVTTHSAGDLDFPFTMTNVRSGTWMMTGNGVMHNGITVIEQYGQSLDRLQVGDRVGVVRKDDGTLHFWVNGIDQGTAASNVPERIFGVIDLYGQAAQASIIDTSECGSPDTGNSTISNTTLYSEPPIRFHSIHGKNAGLSNGCLTAARPNSLAEFNDAIVFSSRPLRQRELFEVVLETMVRHWSGNIEIGVTGAKPEDIQLTVNATDLEANDTIILCGSMIFHNRKTIRSNILVDLDTLAAGARVGVMRNGEFIHFYIDGVDQGPAIECHAINLWAVVDLYGQCAQVSITQGQPDLQAPYATSENSQSCQATSVIQPALLETKHRWTCVTGCITLSHNWTCATRLGGTKAALSRSLIFSEHPLNIGSPFEIKIITQNPTFAGSLKVGVTDLDLTDEHVRKNLPTCMRRIPANIWYVFGSEVYKNQCMLRRSTVCLDWLRVGDRISLELTPTHTLRILLNSEYVNIQFQNIINDVYVVVELMGTTMAVQVTSTQGPTSPLRPCSLRLQDSLDFGVDPLNKQDSMLESIDSETQTYEFSEIHGKNIKLWDERHCAERLKSYNQALVFVPKPLCRGESISVRIDAIDENWKGTIGLGVCACSQLNAIQLPPSIMQCKRPCWVTTHDFININGLKQSSTFGQRLEDIEVGSTLTMSLSHGGVLVLTLDTFNLDALATNIPNHVYPVFDLYGKCTKITLLSINDVRAGGTPIIEEVIALDDAAVQEQEQQDEREQDEAEVPQCEKANLEMNEKETDQATKESIDNDVNVMTRSVMESVSENLHFNMSVRNRSMEHSRTDTGSSCCLRESLQLQHNTNLNIQRSQSTQRFQNTFNNTITSASPTSLTSTTITTATANIYDDNKEYEEIGAAASVLTTSIDEILSCNSKENLLLDFTGHDDNNLALQRCCMDTNYCNDATTDILTEVNVNTIASNQRTQHGSIDSNLDDNSHSENMLLLLHFHQEQQLQQQLQQQQHLQQQQYQQQTTDTSELYFDSIQSLKIIENKNCQYLKLIQQFCTSLVLPQQFFQPRMQPICFCSNCNANKSEKLNGWVYFQLNQSMVNTTNADQKLDAAEWLPLYYVTRVDKIRATLDCGHPLPIEPTIESHATCSNKKDEPGTHLELHFSPNANDIPPLNIPHKYSALGRYYNIGTAFEVNVRRQSLCATDCNNKRDTGNLIDIDFEPSCSNRTNPTTTLSQKSMNDRKWFTKEAGACVITALVLRLDKITQEK